MDGFARSFAVAVGIDAYNAGIPPLDTAVADATQLAALLDGQHGYDTVWLRLNEQADREGLRRLLEEDLPGVLQPDDRLLFYFAGHGVALDGDDGPAGFLIPQDADRMDRGTFLSMRYLYMALNALPCRHLLLVLDCCFAGAFRWSAKRAVSAVPETVHRERYQRYIDSSAWQVLTSASHNQEAWDTFGERGADAAQPGNSPFAAALFRGLSGEADLIPRGKDGLSGGDGVITATELYLYLREEIERVSDDLGLRQTPGLWPLPKHDRGEYIMLAPPQAVEKLPPAPELHADNNPWRGLLPYEQAHRTLFFGRSAVIQKIETRVRSHALTVVVGASGTGKSSVVKAGLLPRLVEDTDNPWLILGPIRPGAAPLAALLDLEIPGTPQAELSLRADHWMKQHPKGRLLLVVDQLEELITQGCKAEDRREFQAQLATVLKAWPDRFRVILTVRSDFEPQFSQGPLQDLWMDARLVLPPLSQMELREVIEGPATVKVLYFEPAELVEKLVEDVAQTPSALSLLSFTLSELYISRFTSAPDNRALLMDDYLKLEGVGGSLRTRAKEELEKLDAPGRGTMRRILLRMISPQGGGLARRSTPRSELIYEAPEENARVSTVLDHLTAARLLVQGSDGEAYVEPAHDVLVRGWDQLLRWSRDAQEELQLRRLLTPAATDWEKHQGGLWHSNPRLDMVQKAAMSGDSWLNALELRFTRASLNRRFVLRLVTKCVAVFSILLLGLLGWSIWQRIEAERGTELQARMTRAESLMRTAAAEPRGAYDDPVQIALAARGTHDSGAATSTFHRALMRQPFLDRVIRAHGSSVTGLQWSPDGKNLASASGSTVSLMHADGSPLSEWHEPLLQCEHPVGLLAWSADGLEVHAIGAGENATGSWEIAAWIMTPSGTQKKVLATRTESPQCMAYAPRQQWIALGFVSGVLICDLRLGKTLDLPTEQEVHALDWHEDGTRLVAACSFGHAGIWTLGRREEKPTAGEVDWVLPEKVTADADENSWLGVAAWGKGAAKDKVALAGVDRKLYVVGPGRSIRSISTGSQCESLAWTSDGGQIAAAFNDGVVRVWSADLPERPISEIKLDAGDASSENRIHALAWNADNTALVIASDHGAWVWQPSGVTEAWSLPHHVCHRIDWHPDGERFAAGDERGVISLASTRGNSIYQRLSLTSGQSRSRNPFSTLEEMGEATRQSHLGCVFRWQPKKLQLALADAAALTLVSVPAGDKRVTPIAGPWRGAQSLVWDNTGTRLAIPEAGKAGRGFSPQLLLWRENEEIQPVENTGWRYFSNPSWIAGSKPGLMWQSGMEVWLLSGSDPGDISNPVSDIRHLAGWQEEFAVLREDGKISISRGNGSTVTLFELPEGAQADRLVWSPDGQTLAALGSMESAQFLYMIQLSGGTVRAIARESVPMYVVSAVFSPDSRQLALGGAGLVTLLDAGEWTLRSQLDVQAAPINLLGWSADSLYLSTGTTERTGDNDPLIRIWRTADLALIANLGTGERTLPKMAEWSSTGHWIAAMWDDRPLVHLWNLDENAWKQQATQSLAFLLDSYRWQHISGEKEEPPNSLNLPAPVIEGIATEAIEVRE